MEELIPIVLFLSIAAVVILRPISKRLGSLLEAMARERQPTQIDASEIARIRGMIEHVGRRMDLIEERLDFTERLIGAGSDKRPAAMLSEEGPRQRERDAATR